MFRYRFSEDSQEISAQTTLPRLIQISRSCDSFQWNTPYHLHNTHIEIAYIGKGIAYYSVDGQAFTAKKGDLIVIEKDVIHSTISSTDNPTEIWIFYVSDFICGHLAPGRLLIDKKYVVLNTNQYNEYIFSTYKFIKTILESNLPSAYEICQNALASLLALLYEMQKNIEYIPLDTTSGFIKDIMLYLNDHSTKNITLTDLAREFHVSASYISHEFKKEYGISPINYIISRRLCEAKWLLVSSKKSLTDIAHSLGYDNVNHFTNLFIKRFGCSPLVYRELHYEEVNH